MWCHVHLHACITQMYKFHLRVNNLLMCQRYPLPLREINMSCVVHLEHHVGPGYIMELSRLGVDKVAIGQPQATDVLEGHVARVVRPHCQPLVLPLLPQEYVDFVILKYIGQVWSWWWWWWWSWGGGGVRAGGGGGHWPLYLSFFPPSPYLT